MNLKELLEFARVYMDTMEESDRGFVLIIHAELDHALSDLFEAAFRSHGTTSKDLKWLLTGENRPLLQSFYVKVKVARALGFINTPTANALTEFNFVRIDAAHGSAKFRLTTKRIEGIRNKLSATAAATVRRRVRRSLDESERQIGKHPDLANHPLYKFRTEQRATLMEIAVIAASKIVKKTDSIAKKKRPPAKRHGSHDKP